MPSGRSEIGDSPNVSILEARSSDAQGLPSMPPTDGAESRDSARVAAGPTCSHAAAAHVEAMAEDLTTSAFEDVQNHARAAARAHNDLEVATSNAREQWARLFDATQIARVAGGRWDTILGRSPAREVQALWRTLGEDQQVRDMRVQQAPSLAEALRGATSEAEVDELIAAGGCPARPRPEGLSVAEAATLLRVSKAVIRS